jgi:isopenicillin-N N-acyltransferase-like protein
VSAEAAGSPAPRAAEAARAPLLELAGDPRECGVQYGRAAGERIERSLAIYRPAFDAAGLALRDVRRIAREFMDRIEAHDPSALEEIRGIAEGAEQPVEDVVALNARTELLRGLGAGAGRESEVAEDGCTAAVVLPGATANRHTLHAQNWDWLDACADSVVVLRVSPREGPRRLVFVEAGILARCGLNSAGIGLTGNFLKCDRDDGRRGLPIPVVRRRILSSPSLCQAAETVYRSPRSFSANLMISDAQGEAIDFEATPDEVFWLAPEDGLLVHANHFVSQAALAKVRDTGLETQPHSLYRDRRVREHLLARSGRISIEDLKAALSDRYGRPYAVCREPVAVRGGAVCSTVATVIMDLTVRRMWVALTPYREHSFHEYALD